MKKIIFAIVTISCFVALMAYNIDLNSKNDKSKLELRQVEALAGVDHSIDVTIGGDSSGINGKAGYKAEWKNVEIWVGGKVTYDYRKSCVSASIEFKCTFTF